MEELEQAVSGAPPTYHLWMKPAGSAYEVLTRTIRDLAAELEVPSFEPHVTLLAYLPGSDEDLHRQRTSALAARLAPTPFVLTQAAYLNEHYRCLFMLVDKTPEVMRCHELAAEQFGVAAGPYMPHLSLVYGTFEESRKRQIIARLDRDVWSPFLVSNVILLKSEGPEQKDWHEVATFPLTAR